MFHDICTGFQIWQLVQKYEKSFNIKVDFSQKRLSLQLAKAVFCNDKRFRRNLQKSDFFVNFKTISLKHTILERKLIETFSFFFLDALQYYSKVVRIYYKTPCIFSDIIHNVNGMTT